MHMQASMFENMGDQHPCIQESMYVCVCVCVHVDVYVDVQYVCAERFMLRTETHT